MMHRFKLRKLFRSKVILPHIKSEITIVHQKMKLFLMRVLVEMINPLGVEAQ